MRSVVFAMMLTALLAPSLAAAQTGAVTQWFQVGDRTTYTIFMSGKQQTLEETWTEVDGNTIRGVQKLGDKEVPLAITTSPFTELMRICISNGQTCRFSPAIKGLDLPLEKGKQWSTGSFIVEGEDFSADVAENFKVDKIESVKVPAGEFDAFKVSFAGTIKGTNKKGERFSGKEDGTHWIAIVAGRPVWVKTVYRNTFGARTTRELISTSFR